ncbi:MAG: Rha family transcriptional regulator [Lentisphaerae bacterium]|jgi:Rha family phage regulatory protein|nr:Rha family transcriptional regulator [Lentisphaerota bacterium]
MTDIKKTSVAVGAAAEANAVTKPVQDLVRIECNRVVTDSKILAKTFGRRHDTIVCAIEALDIPDDWRLRNFPKTQIERKTPTGGTCFDRAYILTRDGFTILAMGFTGKKAMQFKLAYIAAFNRMEAALSSSQSPYGSKGGARSAAASDAPDALPAALPGWDAEAVSELQNAVERQVRQETANLRYSLRQWCVQKAVTTLDELLDLAHGAWGVEDFETLHNSRQADIWGWAPFHPATRRRVVARMASQLPSQSSQSPYGCRGEGIGDDKP